MGDRSPKALVNLGDVVLTNTGDGVITGREPHTSHQSNETTQRNRCSCCYRCLIYCRKSSQCSIQHELHELRKPWNVVLY